MKFTSFIFGLLGALCAAPAFAVDYVGDYAPSSTVVCDFGTVQPSTGASFALAGTPAVSVYKDSNTTESTSGVTLTASFDSRTGYNKVSIDTSSDGTFYSAGSYFSAVITTGTVDSVSVVGQPVCSFTIRKGTITGIPNAVAGASGGLLIAGTNADFDVTGNVGLAGGLSITQSSSNAAALVITGNGTGNGATITSGDGATGNGLSLVAASTNGAGFASAGAGTGAGGSWTGGATGPGMLWTGGATSGNALATAYTSPSGAVKQFGITDSGTLQSATSTTAVLRSGAGGWTVDDQNEGQVVVITQGTGLGQSRRIESWVDSTETATFGTAWAVTPDNTSEYEVYGTPPGSSGGGATAEEVWEYATRELTLFDEDNTTIDINNTATGAAASVTGAVGSVTGNVGGNVTGSVGSVVGAVGSVTGNVGGNVTGSVGSVVGNVGGVDIGPLLEGISDGTGSLLGCTFTIDASPGVGEFYINAMTCTPP